MTTFCKKTLSAMNAKNTAELVLGIFVAMILLVAIDQKYLAGQVAEYLYFALIALIVISVFDKTNRQQDEQLCLESSVEPSFEPIKENETIAQTFFPPEPAMSADRYQEYKNKYQNLLGTKILEDSLEFSF